MKKSIKKIDEDELSLDGVAIVSLDIVNMYTNMSEELGTTACKEYLESRNFQKDGKGWKRMVRLIFTQNRVNPPIRMWIRDCKKLLCKNEKAKDMGERIQICTRQPKNLLRLAGGCKGVAEDPPQPEPGCYKCNHCKVSCPVMNETKTFRSTNTGKSYKIKQRLDCDVKNVRAST